MLRSLARRVPSVSTALRFVSPFKASLVAGGTCDGAFPVGAFPLGAFAGRRTCATIPTSGHVPPDVVPQHIGADVKSASTIVGAPMIPCGYTRGELNVFLEKSEYGKNKLAFDAYFFKDTLPPGLEKRFVINDNYVRCCVCACRIDQHRPADAAAPAHTAPPAPAAAVRRTPNHLLHEVIALRGVRTLGEILDKQKAKFCASNPEFRQTVASLRRGFIWFPYLYEAGHPLAPQLQQVIKDSPRPPVLLNVGVRGSGKTLLLLRALEAMPAAAPGLNAAYIYITFNSNTPDVTAPGAQGFGAALVLRVFHAVLATLGERADFGTFLKTVDWTQFDHAKALLPQLAVALGVDTLVVAVDEVAVGVEAHEVDTPKPVLEELVRQRLSALFNWADTKVLVAAAQPDVAVEKPPVVIPIVSCYYPRYARAAARSPSGRELVPLQVDLAPSLDEVIRHTEGITKEQKKVLNTPYVVQQYAACGGHFLLCASVCSVVLGCGLTVAPRGTLRAKLHGQIKKLADPLESLENILPVALAQAVCGMTFKDLHACHGDAARTLDPFYQSDDVASNLPLIVAVSDQLRAKCKSTPSVFPAVDAAFELWSNAAADALDLTTPESIPKLFEAVTMHGLALRWAALLATKQKKIEADLKAQVASATAATGEAFTIAYQAAKGRGADDTIARAAADVASAAARRVPDAATPPPPPVEFCKGQGFYLNADGKREKLDLSNIDVVAPCKHKAADEFPPPCIEPNTYTLAKKATNAFVEGGGCVAASCGKLPAPFATYNHVYFTVQMKHTFKIPSASFSGYLDNLIKMAAKTPVSDAPCVHLFWTPRPYAPNKTLQKKIETTLRDLRDKHGRPHDIIACVNVHDCLTPSLSWTLTCAARNRNAQDVEVSQKAETPRTPGAKTSSHCEALVTPGDN